MTGDNLALESLRDDQSSETRRRLRQSRANASDYAAVN